MYAKKDATEILARRDTITYAEALDLIIEECRSETADLRARGASFDEIEDVIASHLSLAMNYIGAFL